MSDESRPTTDGRPAKVARQGSTPTPHAGHASDASAGSDGSGPDPSPPESSPPDPSLRDLEGAERVLLLDYRPEQRRMLLDELRDHRRGVLATRAAGLAHDLEPAFAFSALLPDAALPEDAPPAPATRGPDRAPRDAEEATGWTVVELAAALRAGSLTSLDLTNAYLGRIERFDPRLHAFVTTLPERARAEAAHADAELAAGVDRGPLHGIPYAAKDLLAVPGAPTTWGAAPFREQVLDVTATVVRRLEEAGAVLLGKASLGALAMGDVWFGGTTRNPWDEGEGSSGSSAGSAAAVAAGLAAFAIGSETMGSILSPAGRCGVVGLRPSYGRVSRHGAMALSWTLDKLGPMCRSAEDAALVLAAIAGPDGHDATVQEAPFPWAPDRGAAGLRVGVPAADQAEADGALQAFLATLATLPVEVVTVDPPALPQEPVLTILMVEASAAFDDLIRDGRADLLTRQDAEAWPNLLRAARLVSATDYLQAQRLRRRIQREMAAMFDGVDVLVTRNDERAALRLGNAAGLPALSLPSGRAASGRPLGNVALLAAPFFEHRVLALAHAVQSAQGPLRIPSAFAAGD